MKETNMEHFRSEIENIDACLFGIKNGEIVSCYDICCDECSFSNLTAGTRCRRIEWLMAEYTGFKGLITLTEKEKCIAECLDEGFVARDKIGDLFWYKSEPTKKESYWSSGLHNYDAKIYPKSCFKFDLFRFIKWEDEEPWAVADLRKLKVQDEK